MQNSYYLGPDDKMIMTSVYWDQSQPGITMTAPTIRHRDVSDKHVTGALKTKKLEVGRSSQLEHGI